MSWEQVSNAIVAYAFFTEDGVGDTGLTVTVDAYKNKSNSKIVDNQNATELAGGLYYYELASGDTGDIGQYLFIFKTTDTDTDQKQIVAGWIVGRSGVENLDAPISAVDTVVDSILEDTGTTIPGTLSTMDGKLDTIDNFLDTEIAAILEDTGTTLPATLTTITGKIDTIDGIVDDILVDTGTTLDTKINTIDAIVDEIIIDTGTTLDGKLNTIDDFLDTEVAAILADTNELQTDLTNGGRLDLLIDAIKAKTDNIPASPATEAKQDTIIGYIDTEVAAIKAVTDKVDTALELDGAVYRLTENALEQAPTGGSAPSAADIADAVWDEATSGHTGAGSFGKLGIDVLEDTATTIPGTLTTMTGKIDAIDDYVDTEVAAIKAKTDNLPASPAATGDIPSAATIADAVWDEAISGHLSGGSTGASLNAAGSAGDPWTTELPGSYTGSQAGKIVADILVDTGTTLDGKLDAIDDYIDTEVAAIKAKTDNLPASPASTSDIPSPVAIRTEIDSNSTQLAAIVADTNELQTNQGNWLTATGFSTHSQGDVVTAMQAVAGDFKADVSGLATAANLATIDTVVDAIKAKTDDLTFTGTDINATLDGEEVTTDAASRTASKADVSALATSAEIAALNNVSSADITAAVPAAADIADAVWDELTADHDGTGSTGESLATAAAGGGSGTAPTAAEIADAVWEEAIADHSVTSGSTAEQLAAAGASGDPWATAIPGSYTSGQAGYKMGAVHTALTTSAANIAAAVTGTTVNVRRGDTFVGSFTSLGTVTSYTKIWFTIKRNAELSDDNSEVQIDTTTGLLYVNGTAATTAANGSISVTDASAGNMTITIDEAETAKLGLRDGCYYDIQALVSGKVTTLTEGRANIIKDITKATS